MMENDPAAAARVVTEIESLPWLRERGIPTVSSELVTSASEARRVARELGFPVVMKVTNALHKAERNGVFTDVRSEGSAGATYESLIESMAASKEGGAGAQRRVLVQPQVSGLELILGVRRDPTLGACVIIGAGGTMVELLRDVSIGMVPLCQSEASRMLDGLRMRPLLEGYRGAEQLDLNVIIKLLLKVSRLAETEPALLELDLNPVILAADGPVTVDARMGLAPQALTQRRNPYRPLLPRELFEPRTVAVVGASDDPGKPGNRLIRHLRKHSYPGEIIPVNSRAETVCGIPTVSSIGSLGGRPIDLACIAVPAEAVSSVLDECARIEARSVIVFTAGFSESGSDGRRREDHLRGVLGRYATPPRLVGPNSIGIVSPVASVATSFANSLSRPAIPAGRLAFVSQSGAIASAVMSRAWDRGIGTSRWVSTGNELDIDLADYIRFLGDDDSTGVIALFVEAIRDGDAFASAAAYCRQRGKPIVAVKTGKSAVAQRTIGSHTGAIAGSDAIGDAFLRRCGVLRASTLSELVDVAAALLASPRPHGNRVAVLTMSGGVSSLIADATLGADLCIAQLSEDTQTELRRWIPEYGMVSNPVDATADAAARPEIMVESLKTLCDADGIDLILVQLTTNADPSAARIAEALVRERDRASKPILVGRLGAESLAPEGTRIYREAGMPVIDEPERLVAIAAGLVRFASLTRQADIADAELGDAASSQTLPASGAD